MLICHIWLISHKIKLKSTFLGQQLFCSLLKNENLVAFLTFDNDLKFAYIPSVCFCKNSFYKDFP